MSRCTPLLPHEPSCPGLKTEEIPLKKSTCCFPSPASVAEKPTLVKPRLRTAASGLTSFLTLLFHTTWSLSVSLCQGSVQSDARPLSSTQNERSESPTKHKPLRQAKGSSGWLLESECFSYLIYLIELMGSVISSIAQ